MKLLDVAAIVLAVGVTAGASVAAYGGRDGTGAATVVIEAGGERSLYPLCVDREVAATGPLGDELVAIEDGQAFVVSSPCPNQICIAQGRISRPAQWIACLPNRIFITVEGNAAGAPDALAY